MKVLLLFDTREKDLARDLEDFLSVLGVASIRIPCAPDNGLTLQGKEEHYFEQATGAIFLVTPGSERDGRPFPSPSVADEMGQAKQRFGPEPGRVIYLVDHRCNVQAVDQRVCLRFDRSDMRSVLESLTNLVKNLKQAGLMGAIRGAAKAAPAIDIEEVWNSVDDLLRRVCVEVSKLPNGIILYQQLMDLLKKTFGLSQQDTNFAVRNVQLKGLLSFNQAQAPLSVAFFSLSGVGWDLVDYHRSRDLSLASLLKTLGKPTRR